MEAFGDGLLYIVLIEEISGLASNDVHVGSLLGRHRFEEVTF